MSWNDITDRQLSLAIIKANEWEIIGDNGHVFDLDLCDCEVWLNFAIDDPKFLYDAQINNGISLIKLADGYVAFKDWHYIDMSYHDNVEYGCCVGSDYVHEDASSFRAIAIVYLMIKGVCWEDLKDAA